MPRIETWGNLPPGVRQHLIDRMRERAIRVADLNHLRLWIDSNPEVPEGDWYKDFGRFIQDLRQWFAAENLPAARSSRQG